jgi:hypothetical protein
MEEDNTMLDAPSFVNEEEGNDMPEVQENEELVFAETEVLDENQIVDAVNGSDSEENEEAIEESENQLFEEPEPKSKKTKKQSKTSKWILYLSENRRRLMDENPSCGMGEITKLLSEEYKKLSSEEIEALERTVKEINEQMDAAGDEEPEEEHRPKSATDLDLPLVMLFVLFSFVFSLFLKGESQEMHEDGSFGENDK